MTGYRQIPRTSFLVTFSYCGSMKIECRLVRVNAGSFAGIVGLDTRIDAVIVGKKGAINAGL